MVPLSLDRSEAQEHKGNWSDLAYLRMTGLPLPTKRAEEK